MVITAGASGFVDQHAVVVTDNNDDSQLQIVFSAFDGQTTAKGHARRIANDRKDVVGKDIDLTCAPYFWVSAVRLYSSA